MFEKLKEKLTRPRYLTLKLHYPEKVDLRFMRAPNGLITIAGQHERTYRFETLRIFRTTEELAKRVSDGAIMGAAVAAARHGADDEAKILRGAIVGDWIEKQRDKTVKVVEIKLRDDLGQVRLISTKLTNQQYQTVKKFFEG